jgi:hypothetical protein
MRPFSDDDIVNLDTILHSVFNERDGKDDVASALKGYGSYIEPGSEEENRYKLYETYLLANDICVAIESLSVTNFQRLRIGYEGRKLIDAKKSIRSYINEQESLYAKEVEKQNKQEHLRDLEEKISVLTIKNLKLQNREMKLKVIYALIGFVSALSVAYFKEIVKALQQLTQ